MIISASLILADNDCTIYKLRTVTGDDTLLHSWHLSQNDSLEIIKSFYGDERWGYSFDDDGEIVDFIVYDPNEKVYFDSRRDGRNIHFHGLVQGEKTDKTIEIDEDPWYQHVAHCLSYFICSQEERTDFNVVQHTSLKAYKMRAVMKELDTLDFLGKPTEIRRLRFSFAGLIAPFWSADYWMRTSDGLFVKYRGRNGFPPTPITTIEMIDIKYNQPDTTLDIPDSMACHYDNAGGIWE